MADEQIRFDDGAGYEQMMGKWSRLAGDVFLDWLALPGGLHWIDVGCGNGAFTQLIVDRCSPLQVLGIDPSEGQLAFARTRPASRSAQFLIGDAMALAAPEDAFDVAVMALVLFFVPDPTRGLAEMARVLRPGGMAAAYTWDILNGGFPTDAIHVEMAALGMPRRLPPSAEASRIPAMLALWGEAGFEAVETREITVERTFADFDDFWNTSLLSSTTGPRVAALSAGDRDLLASRVRQRLSADVAGPLTVSARANAIKGRLAPAGGGKAG